MPNHKFKLLSALLVLFTTLIHAQVFQYESSGTYVEDHTLYSRQAVKSGTGPYISLNAFSDTEALSPSSGYTGPRFYGGYQFTSSTNDLGFATDSAERIRHQLPMASDLDALYFNVTGGSVVGTEMSFAAVFIFKQEDFNPEFRDGNVAVNGFSIGYAKHATGSTSAYFNPEGRWLVQVDGIYYLSNSKFQLPAGNSYNQVYTTFSLTGTDLENTLWAAYNPQTNLFFDAASAEFESLTLENITAAGFYFDDPLFTSSSGQVGMRLAIGEFHLSGSVIPEPATTALFLIGGLLILFQAKRKLSS